MWPLINNDWIILIVLGASVAVLSFAVDVAVSALNKARLHLYTTAAETNIFAGIASWVLPIVGMVILSMIISQRISPYAAGSGISEIKTILRGVVLKEYLTLKTLISKLIGLTVVLPSGLPIGKEGPFVHIGGIVATLWCKLFALISHDDKNQNYYVEMVAAGCAVGVTCTFGSPIGGVLFSIEVTSVHFALRNYWRGFFSAVFSAIVFQLLGILTSNYDSVKTFSPTEFSLKSPYALQELLAYAILGILCGLFGALFVIWHKQVCVFITRKKFMKTMKEKCQYIYPLTVATLVSAITFPEAGGSVTKSLITSKNILDELFSNFTWSEAPENSYQLNVISQWSHENFSIYFALLFFILYTFIMSGICITLPVACGMFTPVLLIGAALGRLFGELLVIYFPNVSSLKIVPGSYALVGAAAFSGAATQTVSTAVIVFELTGQIVYMVPVLLGVALSIVIATYMYPSIYDVGIYLKRLPFLPNLLPTSSAVHKVCVRDFMLSDLKYLTLQFTYKEIKDLLDSTKKMRTFPLVDSRESFVLIGTVERRDLELLIEQRLCDEERRKVARHCKLKRKFNCLNTMHGKTDIASLTKRDDIDDGGKSVKILIDPGVCHAAIKLLRGKRKHKVEFDCDLNSEEREQWEEERMNAVPNYKNLAIDYAPFQLVHTTTLFRAHAVFSLLSLQRAYITNCGRLVGMVNLENLREAVEGARLFGGSPMSADTERDELQSVEKNVSVKSYWRQKKRRRCMNTTFNKAQLFVYPSRAISQLRQPLHCLNDVIAVTLKLWLF
ncbi:Chloride channel protein 2 [Trichinella pseudospiralis]|uniref:Chloride channel protein 2 n=1 Tax=Trichinella pseudospiralis TaxID=6337 RepID=A0A0V1H5B0_TRIPS|nr:Chloride channel protein 2 [Trichinella pseudospiralis]KRZ05558.1 Chloride channel protein 2 [Trichinella pseudospiralis]